MSKVVTTVKKFNTAPGATETLVFVGTKYVGQVRKFKNTATEKHPHTALAATAGAGSTHDLAGHFNTRAAAVAALVAYHTDNA